MWDTNYYTGWPGWTKMFLKHQMSFHIPFLLAFLFNSKIKNNSKNKTCRPYFLLWSVLSIFCFSTNQLEKQKITLLVNFFCTRLSFNKTWNHGCKIRIQSSSTNIQNILLFPSCHLTKASTHYNNVAFFNLHSNSNFIS